MKITVKQLYVGKKRVHIIVLNEKWFYFLITFVYGQFNCPPANPWFFFLNIWFRFQDFLNYLRWYGIPLRSDVMLYYLSKQATFLRWYEIPLWFNVMLYYLSKQTINLSIISWIVFSQIWHPAAFLLYSI